MREKKFNKRNEKGSITLFVLVACLFFMFILVGVYMQNINKMQTQEQNVKQIQENYARQVDKAEDIYREMAKDMTAIISQEPENDTWTNGKVVLTGEAETKYENQVIAGYAFNDSEDTSTITWETVNNEKTITKTKEVTANGTYYFWVKDGGGNIKKASKEVTNIDKILPTITSVTAATNTITLNAQDLESGISGYAISANNTTPTEFEGCPNKNQIEIIRSGLQQNTTYFVWVKDKAGNISESKEITTSTVPDLIKDTNVTFAANPTTWTNKTVTVRAVTGETNYTLQTSKDSSNWGTENPLTFGENGIMYARLWDGTNGGKNASYNITNIDKVAPTITLQATEATTSTKATQGTISATVTDDSSGISKIEWYYKKSTETSYNLLGTDTYTTMNGATVGDKNVSKSRNLNDLDAGSTYNVYAIAYDVAGNSQQSNTLNITEKIILVELYSGPNKTEYNQNDAVDYTGIKLKLYYAYSKSEIINGESYASTTSKDEDHSSGIKYKIAVKYSSYTFNITTYKYGWNGVVNGIYYYYTHNGVKLTGEQNLPQKTSSSIYRNFYFKSDGLMYTGWRNDGTGYKYYVETYAPNTSAIVETDYAVEIDAKGYPRGAMLAAMWAPIAYNGEYCWFYFKDNGYMCKNEWKQIDGKWYYFEDSGVRCSSKWKQIDSKWYYFKDTGVMCSAEWLKDGDYWYYFKESGAMCVNESVTLNGKTYNFDSSGHCTNP